MSRLSVNPTRMELRRLKDRLKTAVRGHKLLKDKSDEMIRRFMLLIRQNKLLREQVETELGGALKSFTLARAVSTAQEIEQALCMPVFSVEVEMNLGNVLGVDVPSVGISPAPEAGRLPYALGAAPFELDTAVIKLSALTEKLLKLAEVEKTCNMLAAEIERNRRRVNALEYVMIPSLQETIRYIMMKMDENERGALTRLMKVKSLIEKRGAGEILSNE